MGGDESSLDMQSVWSLCGSVCVGEGGGGYFSIFMKLFQILNIDNKGSAQSLSC